MAFSPVALNTFIILLLFFSSAANADPKNYESITYALETKNSEPVHKGERIRVRGTVTLGTNEGSIYNLQIYIQDESGGIKIYSDRVVGEYKEGDQLEVEGTVEPYYGEIELVQPVIKVLGRGPSVKPRPISIQELNSGTRVGELIEAEGIVNSILPNFPDRKVIVLKAGKEFGQVFINSGANEKIDLTKVQEGAKVRFVGVVSRLDTKKSPKGNYRILVRKQSDIRVLAASPWLSERAIFYLLIVVALLSVVSGLWVFTLRRKLKNKRKELKRIYEQLNEETHRRLQESIVLNQRLKSILNINQKMLSDQSLNHLLDLVLATAADLLRADAGTLRLAENNCTLRVVAVHNTERKGDQIDLPIDGNSIAGRVFLTGEPQAVSNLAEGCYFRWSDVSFASLLTVPLRLHNQGIGVFSLYSNTRRQFSEEDINLASLFASQVAISIDMAQNLEKAKHQAIVDGLTGLYNHRYFHERLDEEIHRAKTSHGSMSLLFCDLDNFKAYNDSNGHEAGDQALKIVGKIMKQCIRDIDVAARYGGEEFAIILPEVDETNAQLVAERIRNEIGDYTFPVAINRNKMPLTISIGIASFPQDAQDKKSLVDKADWAMYYAKRKGKNQVKKFSVEKYGQLTVFPNLTQSQSHHE